MPNGRRYLLDVGAWTATHPVHHTCPLGQQKRCASLPQSYTPNREVGKFAHPHGDVAENAGVGVGIQ
ncbi:MAG TPA: hypothetical protein PK299_01005 [Anaerolineales bacterium]|nr:hypothetical protein [Anaerolineales bacterium]